MLAYTLGSVLAHRTRLVLTAAAIMLGVGAVSGTFVLTDTARAAADAAFTDAGRGVNVVVVDVDPAGPYEDLASSIQVGDLPRVPAAVVDRVATVPGVATATGAVFGAARLIGRDGRLVGGGRSAVGRSLDPSFADRVRDGRLPAGPGEVVVDRTTAREQRFRVGDTVRVTVSRPDTSASSAKGTVLRQPGPPRAVTVVGILDSPEYPDWTLAGFDPATARELLGAADGASVVEVRGAPGIGARELRDRVAAAVGPGHYALTSAELSALRSRRAQPDDVTNQVALVGAAVALFVGMFVIRNTFTIMLASRARELALLRCVGASRAQLRRSVLLESSVVGAVASVAGLAFGVAVAWGLGLLLRSIGDLRVDITGTVPRILPRTVLVAIVLGVVTAMLSAWSPARRAARVAPVEALRGQVFAVDRREGRVRAAVGAVLTAGGLALVGLGAVDGSAYLGPGAAATAVGILVLGPVLARSLSRALGAPIGRMAGAPGQLARHNAARNPRRTSAAVLPLVIGLALTTMIVSLAAATKAWAVSDMDSVFRADFLVRPLADPQDRGFTPLSLRVADRLTGLPELAAVAAFRSGGIEVAGTGTGVTAVDPAALARVLSLHVSAGSLAELSTGTVAVSRQVADGAGLAVGSPVAVHGPRGDRMLTVRAIYERPELGYVAAEQLNVPVGGYLVTAADYERLAAADDTDVSEIYLVTRTGVAERRARAAVERALADDPAYASIEILSRDQQHAMLSRRIDPALRLYYSLLGLMVVIALFGIVNTQALHILERVRELGLVRAIGMDRRQVRAMVRWEALIVATIGTATGLSAGAFLGWALTRASKLPVTLPVGTWALVAAGAVLVVGASATLPARRAGRVDLLRAIAAE